MTQHTDHIHVFKSNINSEADADYIRPALDNNPKIECWSVDLNDPDFVLRIVAPHITKPEIVKLVGLLGYECSELE
jgi:hypothetical protein